MDNTGNEGHRQRVKEKILHPNTDATTLQPYELLEALLFHSIPRKDVKDLAKQLIKRFGSVAGVINAPSSTLLEYNLLTSNTLALFKLVKISCSSLLLTEIKSNPTLNSLSKIIDYCYLDLSYQSTEKIRVLYLNQKQSLIFDELLHEGDVNSSMIYPRNILKKALDLGALYVILAHNHPSGDPTPSTADIETTIRLNNLLKEVKITLLDHIIVGKYGVKSLKGTGILN